jgi:transposase
VVKVDLDRLRELVAQQPDASTRELHERLGTDCSVSAVDMALRRLGLSFKKRRSMRPSRTGPMSPASDAPGGGNSPAGTHGD